MSYLTDDINHAIHGFLDSMQREGEAGRPSSVSLSVDRYLQSCLSGEHSLRRLFATDPANRALENAYVGLFKVFDLPVQATLARPRDWTEQECFPLDYKGTIYQLPLRYILPIAPRLQRIAGTPCIVDDLSAFRTAWDTFSGGALSSLRSWDNILVAGGSVLACLSSFPSKPSTQELFDIYQSFPYERSDIDLFLWGLTEDEAKAKMQEIFEAVNSVVPWDLVCFRTKNTITIQAEYPKRPIQIVMRLYTSPAEILCGFDVDACCVAYDGTNVFMTARSLAAVTRQCNTIDLTRRSPSYEHRLAKYSERGYEVYYPNLQRENIKYTKLSRQDRDTFPKGLGRLLVSELINLNFMEFFWLYADSSESDHLSSPVPLDSLRPSNYDYAWVKIPYGERWWNVQKVKKHVEKKGLDIVTAQGTPGIHQHVVTCGTMAECLERCCNAPNTGNGPLNGQGLANGFFKGPPQFIVDDPGRQTTGSFNPIGNDDVPDYSLWELEAYQEDNDNASD